MIPSLTEICRWKKHIEQSSSKLLRQEGMKKLNCKLLRNYDLYITYTAHRFFHSKLLKNNFENNQQMFRERIFEIDWCPFKILTVIIIIIIIICLSRRKKVNDFINIFALIRRVHYKDDNNNCENRRDEMKVFCEDENENESVIDETLLKWSL